MSLCSKFSKSRLLIGLLVILAVSLISFPAFSQSDANPKWDLFVGYQWLHPGGTVPAPFGDFNNPYALQDSRHGTGIRQLRLPTTSILIGARKLILVITGEAAITRPQRSIGPRFIWRTDSANYFLTHFDQPEPSVGKRTQRAEWYRSHPGRRHGFAH